MFYISKKTKVKILLFFLLITGWNSQGQKLLFLGNSLTYSNNMPSIIQSISNYYNISIKSSDISNPNYAIEDHWNDGKFQKLITEQEFDYLILQQGPSSQPPGKKMLEEYGNKIKSLCDRNNIKMAYFMVWPSIQYYHTFDGVIANYKSSAQKNNALLFPVGKVWKKFREENRKLNLYSFDNFHPSLSGSFLAALTIFHILHPDKNLAELKFKKFKKWVNDETAFQLMIKLVNES